MQQLNKKKKAPIVLVAGGTNPLGLSIVQYFLKQAATVIVPAKSLDEIITLRAIAANINSGRLITHLSEIPDYDMAYNIAESIIEKYGRIDIGIALFNSKPSNGPLTELRIGDWQIMLDNEITPFFVSARLILHSMKAGKKGLYVSLCNGNPFEQDSLTPLLKFAAQAKMEMSKLFAEETKQYNIRYYHLWIKDTGEFYPNAYRQEMNAEIIGGQVMKLYDRKLETADEVFQSVI